MYGFEAKHIAEAQAARLTSTNDGNRYVVEALILALADRDDAGDKADGDLLAGILSELHGGATMNQSTFAQLESEIPAWQREHAKLVRRQERSRVAQCNAILSEMFTNVYTDGVPLDRVNDALRCRGFDELESMILCGRVGSIHEPVGRNRWLSLTWHKMESGRYEVVAYVS